MKHILTFLFFFFFCGNIFSQDSESKTFSLKQAQEYAKENSYEIQNAQIDISISKKKVWETTAIGLPQVNFSASYQNMLEIPTQLMPDFITGGVVGVNENLFGLEPIKPIPESKFFPVQFGTKHNLSWELMVTQLIFSGEYIVGLKASKTYREFSKKQLTKIENDVKYNVSESYFMVLVAQENAKILENSLKNIRNTVKETEAMYKAGFVEDTNIDQLKLTEKSLENALNSLKRNVEVAELMLKVRMGVSTTEEVKLSDNLNKILTDSGLEQKQTQSFDVNKNADYQMLETQEQLSALSLSQQKTNYLPTLSAFYQYKRNGMDNDFGNLIEDEWYPSSILGLQLKIPIFTSGSRIVKVQQAKLELEKVKNSKKQATEGLQVQYNQSKNDFETNYINYKNEKENMELAKRIYDKTLKKYKEGISSSFDLTQAQNQYLDTQSKYFNSAFELLKADAKLNKLQTE